MAETISFDQPVRRGEAIDIAITIYTTSAHTAAEDITGWTLALTIAKSKDSTDKLIGPKSCTLVTAASGTATVSLASAETANLEPGSYWVDLWRTNSGYERVLAEGTFQIKGTARIPA